MRKVLTALGMAVAIAGSGVPALGANIVANGGFEADAATTDGGIPVSPPTDWSVSAVTDPAGAGSVTDAGADNAFPNSGLNAAYLGDGTLSQLLTTVPDTSYDISFWVGVDDPTTATDPLASFDASFGGTDLFGGTPLTPSDLPFGSYVNFTDTITATADTTTISFTGLTSDDGGDWYLDDVDVEAVPLVTAAPEPSSLLLLLPLFAALPLLRRRNA